MDNKTLNQLQKTVNEVLDVSHRFMKICNDKFDRGFIGELLVLRQLLKAYHNKLSLVGNEIKYYGGSKKNIDIELILNHKTISIDVKATKKHVKGKPSWGRQHAKKYCHFITNNGKQKNITQLKYDNNHYYIFADVKAWIESGNADFYVLSDKKAKKRFSNIYKKCHEGQKRKVNPDSDDMYIDYEHIKDCRDKTLLRFSKIARK